MGILTDIKEQFKAAFQGGVERGKQHSTLTPTQQQHNDELAEKYTSEPSSSLQHGYWSGYLRGQEESKDG